MTFFKFLKSTDTEKIVQAFPTFLKNDILSLLKKVSLKSEHDISEAFEIVVEAEKLEIPYRVYFEIPIIENLTETELLILNCLFTRHQDGFIRQNSLKQILESNEYWTTPFVIQLLGEYVREILLTIEENLSDALLNNINRFIEENPKFFETTKSRMISYWNCYYRNRTSNEERYVGFRILDKVNSFAKTQKTLA
jgi:hypothetical protein